MRARVWQTSVKPSRNQARLLFPGITAVLERPLASATSVSLVEVSPSIVRRLKESSAALKRRLCNMRSPMEASVVMKESMVAMRG